MVIPEGYKQTEIGVIPKDWEVKVIGEFTGATAGGTPSTSHPEYWNGNIPWMSSGELNNRRICDVIGRITSEGYKNSSTHLLPRDCVLMGLAGQGKTRGTVAINYIELCTNQSIAAIFPSNEHNTEYLYQTLQNRYEELRELSSGDGGRGGLNLKIIKNLRCAFPSLVEQEHIANALLDVDSMIFSLEKLIEKKKAIKQGAMQELLTGKRRVYGFNGKWKSIKLEQYCSLITKQTGFDYSAYIKPALTKHRSDDTLPMIQTINFRGKKFDFNTDYYIPKNVAENFPNIILKSKCVLFSIVGASVGNIGLYPGGTSFCGGAIGITKFFDEDDADWVYYYMSSSEGQSQIQFVTKGGAQATVTISDIRSFLIPTPPKEERMVITSILSDMDNEIDALEQKLKKARQLKQGMMQQLLTGKIRLI